MWRLLEQAAKSATANASEYVSTVQEKAQSIVASVQDEATTLLHALGTARTGPVDEILYEEIEDYKAFVDGFKVDARTDEITQALETDDEIRELHEQMVPVQLSYDEFWSRFFFRQHQEEAARRRDDERREQQAQMAAAAAEDSVDLALDTIDSADSADDLDLALEVATDGRDDSSSSATADDELVQKARDADRRAALAWKAKASELQLKLRALTAQLETATQRIAEEKDAQYQSLCDSYEAKMAEVTLRIDDARALGYDAGIQESEAIVAAMRQGTDDEIARLQQQLLAQTDHNVDAGDSECADSSAVDELRRENAALHQQLDEARARVNALETRVAQSLAVTAAPAPVAVATATSDDAKRELELWRMRAVKMKKAKELADAEFEAFKRETEVARRAETDALTQQLADAAASVAALEHAAFENGVAAGKVAHDARIAELEHAVKQSYESGYDAAALAAQREIELLRTEIAVLRAGPAAADMTDSEVEPDVIWSVPVPVLGDEFSDTDAMSHSIDNLHNTASSDAGGDVGGGGVADNETWDASASVSDDALSDAPRDDWGEW